MTVCKFWAQGSCRYGNSCRFEHPRNVGQSSNRFSALGNQGGNQAMDYGITAEQIQKDLTTEVPQWILSCYGPGKDAPEQLFGGFPREQSFEEIRLFFMEGLAKGNPQGALQDINAIYEQAQTQMRTVLNDIPGAVKFIQDAAQKHPNRIDICNQGTAQQQSTTSPFGRPTQTTDPFGKPAATSSPFGGASTTTSAFGQPAALGQKPNPFGAPAFGQPAQPSTSAFGQPSALGSTSAFGKPAVTTSAFGQPSQPTSAFGQPSQPTSAFGQPSQPTGAFGQPSALGAKPNPFGAPAFGQPAQPTSTFGQTSQPTSAFGQPAALGVKPNPFGAPAASASPFGAAASTTQSTTSAFGQPSQPAATNPFGQPATTTTASPFGQAAAAKPPAANPFGQPAAPAANPFGQPTTTAAPAAKPFGQPAAPAATTTPSPFGQPTATTTPAARPFGQPAAPSASTTGGSVFGQPAQPAAAKPNPFGQPAPSTTAFSQPAAQPQAAAPPPTQDHNPYGPNASREHPHPRSYIVKNPNGSVSQFNGKPVVYATFKDKQVPVIRSFDGSTNTRVWFPDGPPGYTNETEAADPKVYEDPKVRQQWGKFVETGSFEGGVMPEVPPKREFCNWVF